MSISRIFTAAALCFALSGCAQNLEEQIIGRWQRSDGTVLKIAQNGESSIMAPRGYIILGTYQWTDANHIRVDHTGSPTIMEVQVSGDTLTTNTDGKVETWRRIG